MKHILVSQVGFQPGSVAAVAKTLHGLHTLDEILLLTSGQTARSAELLEEYCRHNVPGAKVESCPVGDTDAEFVAEILRTECSAESRVFFNTAAGRSFFVGKLAYLLRGVAGITAVHADFEELYEVGGTRLGELQSIELDELLKLHDLAASRQADHFFLLSGDERVLEAAVGFERCGWFYCLLEIKGAPGLPEEERKKEAKRILAQVRAAEVLVRGDPRLKGLRPSIIVKTDSRSAAERLGLLGIPLIDSSAEGPERRRIAGFLENAWRAGKPTLPGRAATGEQPEVVGSFESAGGGGAPLVVCLGNDPGSTLSALWSQEPAVAWVLYERETPAVRQLAAVIPDAFRRNRARVGRVRFLPVSRTGQGIDAGLVQSLRDELGAGPEQEIYANVSPGSKAQSWALGALEGFTPCSLDTRPRLRRVSDFTRGDAPVPGSEFRRAPLAVVAAVRGKHLLAGYMRAGDLERKSEFLAGLTSWIAQASRQARNGLVFVGSETKERDRLDRFRGVGVLEWSQRPEGRRVCLDVTLERRGSLLSGTFSLPKRGHGAWLEELVGHAFLAARAEDVAVSIRWLWPEEERERHRTEIDVAFLWKGETNPVGVSVKARGSPPASEVEKWRREISAMTFECLGRMALPVLVYGFKPGRAPEEEALEGLRRTGVLELPVAKLDDIPFLAGSLSRAFDALKKPSG